MTQLEFNFHQDIAPDSLRAHIIKDDETVKIPDEKIWYRTNKFGDWVFDTVPYGWRVYYKYSDFRTWVISKYQQLRYGVADSECWSLNYNFSRYMLPRLKHFKKMTRYSYPSDVTPEEWENILDEIIWVFEYMVDEEKYLPMPKFDSDIETIFDPNRPKTLERELEWKEYFDKLKSFQYRKQEALKLSAKYYEALWD